MAFMLCPICGAEFHCLIADPATWYAERYPDIPSGSLAPGTCFMCFPKLAVGDDAEIRNHDSELNGTVGIIDRIATDPHGSGDIYFLLLPDGRDLAFPRFKLAEPQKEQSTGDDTPEDGYF